MSGRPRVLILSPYFVPGEQGGGSVLAVRYLVEQLGQEFDFTVATSDRDFGATQPYTLDERVAAQRDLGISIHYLPPGPLRLIALWRLLNQPLDLLYLNSVLSPGLALLPLMLRKFSRARLATLLLAPRGELKRELLAIKPRRKRIYLHVVRSLGLLRSAQLHATSAAEHADMAELDLAPIQEAADLAPTRMRPLPAPRPPLPGPLRIAFVSRIDRNKNLAQVLRVLAGVSIPVQLDIAGPVGDGRYWEDCKDAIRRLPSQITVRVLGPIPHADVLRLLGEQELFFLPTWSENHGYVIHEALLAGCALLISDRTPWQDIEKLGIGWDLPLDDDQRLVDAIESFGRLSMAQRLIIRKRAQSYGESRAKGKPERAAMLRLMRHALAKS